MIRSRNTVALLVAGAALSACAVNPSETAPKTLAAKALASCVSKPAADPAMLVAARAAPANAGIAVPTAGGSPLGLFVRSVPLTIAGAGAAPMTAAVSARSIEPAAAPRREVIVSSLAAQIDSAMVGKPSSDGVARELRENRVVKNVMRVITIRKLAAFRSAVNFSSDTEVMALLDDRSAESLRASGANVKALMSEAIDSAAAPHAPERLSHDDFKQLYQSILSPRAQQALSRVVHYQAYYFNGEFVDRFGNNLAKPSISYTVTNENISGALSALLESIADEIFPNTPVWSDQGTAGGGKAGKGGKSGNDGPKFYPGASAKMPSALMFEAFVKTQSENPEDAAKLALPLVDPKADPDTPACGMTELKARALMYLTGKSATWASGQAGLLMGLIGGANLGLPIALGKISIGDNQTLQVIVQTILGFMARRATYEATWPLLYQVDEHKYATLGKILEVIVFKHPGDSSDPGKGDDPEKTTN